MEYIILGLVVLILIITYALWNSLRKYEILELELNDTDTLIETAHASMKKAFLRMTSIDRLGAFEADDESGYIFEQIKDAMELLNNEYNLDGEEQKETK